MEDESDSNVNVEPQQEPVELLAVPSVVTAVTTVTAVRLDSGADDNLSTAMADVQSQNMDKRSRHSRSRGRRSRSHRSRILRSRSRRSRRGRSQRSRRRRSRSRSNDSDFSVHIAEDEIPVELVASTSRGGQKTASGGRRVRKVSLARGRRGRKATRGRKSTRGRRRRKTAKSASARSIWSGRLRSNNTSKKSKAK